MLSPLPARKALSEEIEDASYAVVMDGMTAYGLEEAVKAALKGQHGSTFFPSPPEFRKLYDDAMIHFVGQRERQAHRVRLAAERPPELPPRTPAEIERHKQRMANLYKTMGWDEEGSAKVAQPRVHLDPELVAQVPDAPSTWKKIT